MPGPASIVRIFFGFIAFAIATALFFCAALLLFPWRHVRIKLCNVYGKSVGYTVTRLAGATPIVRHRERIRDNFPAIYVANHTSTLDVFLSIWLCPVGGCGIAKKQITKVPFFGQLYLLSGHLLIDRADRARAIGAVDEAVQLVKKYRLGIWIMPEGTRSRDGRLQPFKPGFVHLAVATGLPVVPIVFHGLHRTWQKGSLDLNRIDVPIDVLPAIETTSWTTKTARAHAEFVHDVVAAALSEDQRPLVVGEGT
ncbi:MAG: 1-acyl-sn-glycerol-3-phosphate acyltransferase [Deltaproteobacteria bacterium]|nr:1-acyl-sn-glycerol-3-phosphate acyltransferase [Deltaproteobacteria bacterium]